MGGKLMKIFTGALVATWTILCVGTGLDLSNMSAFGPNPIDSWVDIVFLELICFGGWLVMLILPIAIFARTPFHKMRAAKFGAIGAYAFMIGLYYHVICNAPW